MSRLREAAALLALAAAVAWSPSSAAGDAPPSKSDPAPPSGSDGGAAPPPAQGVPNKGGAPEPEPTPTVSPAPAPQTPAPKPPAKKKPAKPPKPSPEPRHHAGAGAGAVPPTPETLQELASGSSVKAAALAAMLRMQDRLKRAQALEDQARSASPQERTTGSVGDQLRMMAAELQYNVPEVGSAAIEADRLRQQAERMPEGQPGSRRREVRQAAFDLQQLANQMQGLLDDEKAAADRLSAVAGPAP